MAPEDTRTIARGILPKQEYARQNQLVTAVSDAEWLHVRGTQLRWDSNPTSLKADLQIALEQYLTSTELKEILADERTDGQSYLTKAMDLYQSIYSQSLIRALAPAFVGAIDAAATTTADVWVTDSWNHILGEAAKLMIPAGLPNLTRALNPICRTAYPQPVRKYRGGNYLYWAPHLTAAEAWTAIGTLKTYAEAFNYFGKCKNKMVQFSLPDPLVIDPFQIWTSNYGCWLASTMFLQRRNNANTGIYHLSLSECMVGTSILDANLLTGVYTADTWYQDGEFHAKPGEPFSDLYALYRYLGTYDATHNTRGSAVQFNDACLSTTMAAGKLYEAEIAHDGTSFTIVDDADIFTAFMAQVGGLVDTSANLTCYKDTGGAENACAVYRASLIPIEFITPSSTWMNDVEINFLQKVVRGEQLQFGLASSDSIGSITAKPREAGARSRNPGSGKGRGTGRDTESEEPKGRGSKRRGDFRRRRRTY